MVFAGRRLCDEKYDGGPPCEPSWPNEPKTLVGLLEAECEFSCEKLRSDEVANVAASGDVCEMASGREVRSMLEPVEAISRVRNAMVKLGAMVMTGMRSSKKFHLDRRAPAGSTDPRLVIPPDHLSVGTHQRQDIYLPNSKADYVQLSYG
jgi:hypothetical protein